MFKVYRSNTTSDGVYASQVWRNGAIMPSRPSHIITTLYTSFSVERIKRDITDVDDDKALNLN
jgi:hypothetical protein